MKLQTQISITPQNNQIDYEGKLLLLGSCFSENIGNKLNYYKFPNCINPFGIIFNPVSLENLINRALTDTLFTETDVFEKEGIYHSLQVHSLVSSAHKEDYLRYLNTQLGLLKEYLSTASHLIITLGTSWVYRLIETRTIVANCHKIPQQEFSKELLSQAEVTASIQRTMAAVHKMNPMCQLIFTVSPVRHIKDGLSENSVSKAHLRSAIHTLVTSNTNVHYFPAFEIMMDELRDYRFYSSDMLHPNETAIEIIWGKFCEVWVSSSTKPLQKEIDIIQKGLAHRPFHPERKEHLEFIKQLQQRIDKLQISHPSIEFSSPQ